MMWQVEKVTPTDDRRSRLVLVVNGDTRLTVDTGNNTVAERMIVAERLAELLNDIESDPDYSEILSWRWRR